ncbi:helix-turn-helix transcriptional regulator [Nocardioides sp. SOB77]|uniref:Helix-turn-helix transcriptional regulator n=1 Tax=Nocardioides oceani TaxID=3058369 RepID=A0ABT8FIG9_9ACTN|nr:helix-turn-helix transcriptional regulator [Nocardioides oceani]MDN4174473.1 helix-turn-helix transcriptional regulator [Nocardioides oceani]
MTAAIGDSGVALLPISADGPTLVNAVRRAARARVGVRAGVGAAPRAKELPAELSDREVEVLRGIAAGCSNEEIAAVLFVSINTVKTYIRTAYRKLHVARRAEAVAWVMSHEPLLRGRAGGDPFRCRARTAATAGPPTRA